MLFTFALQMRHFEIFNNKFQRFKVYVASILFSSFVSSLNDDNLMNLELKQYSNLFIIIVLI